MKTIIQIKNKKGISQVLTTILIILASLVLISLVWVGVSNFMKQGASKITTTPYTLDLKIQSAKLNLTEKSLTVRVERDAGEGDVSELKIIIEDPDNAEVYQVTTGVFPEFSSRTFTIDLSNSQLALENITQVSVAPVYSEGGTSTIGIVVDSTEDISLSGIDTSGYITEGTGEDLGTCEIDGDCPEDEWVGVASCNDAGDTVIQDYKDYFCQDTYCIYSIVQDKAKEICPAGEICYDGACIEQQVACETETDCGEDAFIEGSIGCSLDPDSVTQEYRNYSCIDGYCDSVIERIILENCQEEGFTCINAECVEPLECTRDSDCWDNPSYGYGYICNFDTYKCEQETFLYNGTVKSSWPYGIGQYFDSYDLPQGPEITEDPLNKYIIFPESQETRCFRITEYYPGSDEGTIPYVKLNESSSQIASDDKYEIWKTSYGCTQI